MPDTPITLPHATLSYFDASGHARSVRIHHPVFTIGRLRTNDLQINNSYISRRHAEIAYENNVFVLRDQQSTGGCLVNGIRVIEHTLASGDQLQLGDTHPVLLVFEMHEGEYSSELLRTSDENTTTDRLIKVIANHETRFLNTALLDGPEAISDQTLNRLKTLNETNRRLLSVSSSQSLLEVLLDASIETLSAERGVIMLRDIKTGALETRLLRSRAGQETRIQPSLSIANQAFEKNVAIRGFESGEEHHLAVNSSIVQQTMHSVMCAPISSTNRVWGVCYIDNRLSDTEFSDEELEYFLALTQQAGLALENLRLIEELRATQERLINSEKLATLGQFASGIAHELKNQLSTLTAAEMLLLDTEDQEKRRLIQIILSTQQRMLSMINEISDFARPSSATYERKTQPLVPVIEEALNFARFDICIKPHRIDFQANAHPSLPLNRDKIMQVILNLLRNGAQAMTAAHGTLSVVVDADDAYAVVRVSDNGCGIPPEQLHRIWDPFFTTKGGEGTGLGLGISRRIIEGHNGVIHCQSLVNQGTTFTIRLPIPSSMPSR
jgi:signal transduction histidine kinase